MIKGITETSFLDWDGHVVMVLYSGPCNFRCGFCHNWELITKPEKFPEKDWDAEVRDFIMDRSDFLDAVCFTGGEPCLDPDLMEMVLRVKGLGLKVKLDTNGSRPDILSEFIEKGLIDYVAMDLKAPLDDRYSKVIGVDAPLSDLKKSVDMIRNSGIEYEFRTTVVPTLHSPEDIIEIARSIEGADKLALQQFNPDNTWDPEMRALSPYANEEIQAMADQARKFVKEVVVRGLK